MNSNAMKKSLDIHKVNENNHQMPPVQEASKNEDDQNTNTPHKLNKKTETDFNIMERIWIPKKLLIIMIHFNINIKSHLFLF